MPKVFIEAPTDTVFAAMCDLTRHAKWAKDDITIVAGQDGPPAVGSTYTSSTAKAKAPDNLTITEMSGNQRLVFHSVMPNSWEIDFTMNCSSDGSGTTVDRSANITKMPMIMFPVKLLIGLMGPKFDQKMLDNMKSDLESAS